MFFLLSVGSENSDGNKNLAELNEEKPSVQVKNGFNVTKHNLVQTLAVTINFFNKNLIPNS